MAPYEDDTLASVFFPYATEKQQDVKDSQLRFAYYTTAETAHRIICNHEIWMRNTLTMNDYLEVEHGFDCLNTAYKSTAGAKLREVLDSLHEGLSDETQEFFNRWLPDIRNQTYITCLSEHPKDEDRNGRLSMWRAYGGNAGVAIVINASALSLQADDIGVFSSPVAYWSQIQVEQELLRVAARIEHHRPAVQAVSRARLRSIMFNVFHLAVLCTKHPGFAEEREWRIIAAPRMYDSPLLTPAVEVIRGVPQPVQKLSLCDLPDKGIVGLSVPSLIERIILGPCDYPAVVLHALQETLRNAGHPSSDSVIHISDIPLRTNH